LELTKIATTGLFPGDNENDFSPSCFNLVAVPEKFFESKN
jgi:hypothetical protein